MSFKLRNIGGHPVSTLWGILFMSALLAFVYLGKCNLHDIEPLTVLVIPFLLYGPGGNSPGATPAYDSSADTEQRGIGEPGADG
ncbi:hypothetical protein Q5H93_02990 [Hymenobacter sp. ASUV-10]|uniref:DUF805 domain-containing protein n=1 Tax=Hymenobacter aranciens TaxID=3063996 RepID=A0ABT9B7B6_9BACT|nr:hypothetical protein [Hymenobacter sp. ASUV-10]MDO7873685.1 hypothetical protein [Hymenobacter sp. ASUV-10]